MLAASRKIVAEYSAAHLATAAMSLIAGEWVQNHFTGDRYSLNCQKTQLESLSVTPVEISLGHAHLPIESNDQPMVSVIIPTRNRAQLLRRAILSVTRQTYRKLEIIVVIDGPDAESESVLHSMEITGMQVLTLERSVGGAQARNLGIAKSIGNWIALLDDDDEWLEQKIERQVQLATSSISGNPKILVACRYELWCDGSSVCYLPRRDPKVDENTSEYLFCSRSFSQPQNGFLSSTLFFSRELAQTIAFTPGLPRHQDGDWFMRALRSGAQLIVAPEVLVLYHADSTRSRISNRATWRDTLTWARGNPDFSPMAYSSFLIRDCLYCAAREGRRMETFPVLPREALTKGKPTLVVLALMLLLYCVPFGLVSRLRNWIDPQRRHSKHRKMLTDIPAGEKQSRSIFHIK